jgi:hypothetical protein
MADIRSRLVEEIPRLRRSARAFTRDVTAADDLVQNCLTRAVSKSHLWQDGTDLRARLFTILPNQYVNQVRRAGCEGKSAALCDAEHVTMAPIKKSSSKCKISSAPMPNCRKSSDWRCCWWEWRHAVARNFCRSRRAGGDRRLAAVTRARGTAPVDEHGNRAGRVRPRRGAQAIAGIASTRIRNTRPRVLAAWMLKRLIGAVGAEERCCLLNEDDQVVGTEDLNSYDDGGAHRDAMFLLAKTAQYSGYELWRNGRKVDEYRPLKPKGAPDSRCDELEVKLCGLAPGDELAITISIERTSLIAGGIRSGEQGLLSSRGSWTPMLARARTLAADLTLEAADKLYRLLLPTSAGKVALPPGGRWRLSDDRFHRICIPSRDVSDVLVLKQSFN